ncbi:MAG: DUF2231 domain-containing protein [Deltaproteobacteria bacterium]|jgi:uncharacterized membrane protein
MAIRIEELHPSLVHFPIALLPVAVGADAIALVTGSRDLRAVGRLGIVLAAAGAGIAGITGLIAQEEVELDEASRPILQTHRTLNVAALGVVTAMAIARVAMTRPSIGYLAAGLAAFSTVAFSAYLGSKLVYDHGVAVEDAGGTKAAPTVVPPRASPLARVARDLANGVAHAARDMAQGVLVPALRHTDGAGAGGLSYADARCVTPGPPSLGS